MTGSCLCSEVRFEVTGEHAAIFCCHARPAVHIHVDSLTPCHTVHDALAQHRRAPGSATV